MERYLYTDIETIPAQRPDVLEEIRAGKQQELDAAIAAIRPPGNYKKQDTIDQWMAEEAPKQAQALRDAFEADVDATYRKTSLDGSFGQVCVIGYTIDDNEPQALKVYDWRQPSAEASLLADFAEALTQEIAVNNMRSICVVGHNCASFDLRFLVQRSIVNGIRPHPVIAHAAQAKPWESEKVFDTMIQWAGIGNRIKLDKLCKALSIPTPKGDLDGSKVWDFVRDGRIDEVAAYCLRDVAATRSVHRRLTFQEVEVMELDDVPA